MPPPVGDLVQSFMGVTLVPLLSLPVDENPCSLSPSELWQARVDDRALIPRIKTSLSWAPSSASQGRNHSSLLPLSIHTCPSLGFKGINDVFTVSSFQPPVQGLTHSRHSLNTILSATMKLNVTTRLNPADLRSGFRVSSSQLEAATLKNWTSVSAQKLSSEPV